MDVATRLKTLEWLKDEFRYQGPKNDRAADDRNLHERGLTEAGEWSDHLWQYFKRAEVLGLDNPLGRQAIAKFAATALGLVDAVQRVYGPLPAAGVPSGVLQPPDRTERGQPLASTES